MTTYHVTSLARIPCRALDTTVALGTNICITHTEPWEDLCIVTPAKLSVTAKMDDGQHVYTTKLVFASLKELRPMRRFNYRIGLANGQQLLLAPTGRPYPTAELSLTLPDSFRSEMLPEYTIEATADTPPLLIMEDNEA